MAATFCQEQPKSNEFRTFNHAPEVGEKFKVIEVSKPTGILVAKCQYESGVIGYLALSQFQCELGMNLFTSTFMVAEKSERILIRGEYRYPAVKYSIIEL